MQKWVLVAALVVLVATPASAFDGYRKGFVLGGGLGGAATSFKQELSVNGTVLAESETESKAGLLTDFRIGYGPSEQVLVYYFNHVTWFTIENIYENDVTIANGVGGLGITYYLNPAAPSFIIVGGVGLSAWAVPFEDNAQTATGVGIWFGGGYEFSRHWNVEATVGFGNPSDKEAGIKLETKAMTFGVAFTGMAY